MKYYLLHGCDGQGFPIMQEQFDRVLEDAMMENVGSRTSVHADGAEEGGTQKHPKGTYCDDGEYIFVYAASQEDADVVRGLVESADTRCEWNLTIMNVINEEAQGYFSGQVDLDGTVKKIQNRVALFLQESS